MSFRIPAVILLFLLAIPAGGQEVRGFWVDGFADGFKTPQQVDQLLDRLRRAHCNAVFAQMRKSADAYYQSRYDVWAADDPERFDALKYLIEKAHSGSPRIQVHAWLNTMAVGKDRGNPLHVTLTHPDWLSISDKGETHDGEATKLDPGNPEVADYTARIYLDVLRHYDVDGIHFDFVRYGGANWGYNPASVSRFCARNHRDMPPAPQDPLWKQWRRDQVTALVRKVYVLASALKPKAQVSAATITWNDGPRNQREWDEKSAAMNRVFQDWRSWMKEGILDLNCLMSYYDERKHPDWYRHWLDWAKDSQFGRFAALANGSWLNLIPDSFAQIAAIRSPSRQGRAPRGVLLYCYAATNKGPDGSEERFNEAFYSALSQPSPYSQNPPFAKPTEYPKLPWKDSPAAGSLYGFVFARPEFTPADGVEVAFRGQGVRRVLRTDGTGFFGAVGVRPGEYEVAVRLPGVPRTRVTVTAGRAVRTVFAARRDPSSIPVFRKVSDLAQIGPFSPVLLSDLIVLAGTDTMPGQLLVTDTANTGVLRVELAEKPTLAFQPGDEVLVTGRWDPTAGETFIGEARVRWIGAGRAAPATPFTAALRGRVVKADRETVVVENDERAEVALGARKGPGIEDPVTALPSPAVGSTVRVAGIAVPLKGTNGITRRIYPVNPADLEVISSAAANTLVALLIWSGIALAAGLVAYAALRLARRQSWSGAPRRTG